MEALQAAGVSAREATTHVNECVAIFSSPLRRIAYEMLHLCCLP